MNKELIGKDYNETAKNEERVNNAKMLQEVLQEDEIECDYCNKRVKKFMAIDTWMITDDNKNVCYGCQIKNNIGWGEIKIN